MWRAHRKPVLDFTPSGAARDGDAPQYLAARRETPNHSWVPFWSAAMLADRKSPGVLRLWHVFVRAGASLGFSGYRANWTSACALTLSSFTELSPQVGSPDVKDHRCQTHLASPRLRRRMTM